MYYETPSNIISYKGFKDFSSSNSRNSSISKNSFDENNDKNEIVRIDKVEENQKKNENERRSMVQDQNKNNNNNPFRQSLSTPITKFPKYYRGSVNPNNLSHGIILIDEFNHPISRKTLKRNGLEREINSNMRDINEQNSNNGGRIQNNNMINDIISLT